MKKTIEERTAFLASVKFDFNERQEIEEILSWVIDNPESAARYIVYLQLMNAVDEWHADSDE